VVRQPGQKQGSSWWSGLNTIIAKPQLCCSLAGASERIEAQNYFMERQSACDYRLHPSRRGGRAVQTLLQDLRYSLRQLIKSPGFTLTAVISLALGIGATTAVFIVIYAALMNPSSHLTFAG
jgi:hypothetical protein